MSKRILPLIPAGLVVDQVLPGSDQIAIVTSPRSASAPCPVCAQPSEHIHSHYPRKLRDLPCQGRPVMLHVQVRRFRCLNPACSRKTFAEPLPGTARPSARRTERLGDLQCHLGLALGGEAGMRLAERLAIPISADTLLRLVGRANSVAEARPIPRVIAVDDWAWRRGHRYGTILVDLERNAVVDLLPDRQAESLAEWLRHHPGVEVVARDRAGAYADGVRQGAPDAVQVADRWHLLRNLSEAVRAVVDRQHAAIRRVTRQIAEEAAALIATMPMSTPDPVTPNAAERRSQAAYARRQARSEEAARLKAAGVSLKRIAVLVGAERKTIRRWLRAASAPLWRKPRGISILGPYYNYLDRRWNEGCRNAAQLWRERVTLGFAGRPGTVRQWTGRRRTNEPPAAGLPVMHGVRHQPPSVRHIVRLLMAEDDTLPPMAFPSLSRSEPWPSPPNTEQTFVSRLLTQVPDLAACVAAAKRLNQLLRRQSKESLDQVLDTAAGTALEDFVVSLRRDLNAVQATLDLPWTTSPAEGQINRLKTLKRSMYGRAGFNLLRARVLHAA